MSELEFKWGNMISVGELGLWKHSKRDISISKIQETCWLISKTMNIMMLTRLRMIQGSRGSRS